MGLADERIGELLEPYVELHKLAELDRSRVLAQLREYLDLLLRWNERVNLTSIREPEEVVRRHFGESLFAGVRLFKAGQAGVDEDISFLDFGSGAGFPGLPIQVLYPGLRVTVAESRQKKVAFLREVVRSLALPTEIWPGRVEQMAPAKMFDVVGLRAVEEMESAVGLAADRAISKLAVFCSEGLSYGELRDGWVLSDAVGIPGSDRTRLAVYGRL